MKNSDKPAMPFQEVTGITGGMITRFENHKGMTKRESIIQSLATRTDFAPEFYTDLSITNHELKIWARKMSMMADALIVEMDRDK